MNDLHQLLLVPLHTYQLNHLPLPLKLLGIAPAIQSLSESLISLGSILNLYFDELLIYVIYGRYWI
jgi:hypothetical protein